MKTFNDYQNCPTIHIDHDGVWVDFDKLFFERFGMWPWDTKGDEDFWNVFFQDADKFFLQCPTYEGYYRFFCDVEALADRFGYNVETLTALPRIDQYPDAQREKREAMVMHGLSRFKMKVGPYAVDKKDHHKKGDILIDDSEKNIQQWPGFSIHHNTRYGNNHTFADTLDILRNHFYSGKYLEYLN